MESHVIDAGQSLKRQFEEASACWPNLTSVLILWPEGDPPTEIPSRLKAPYGVPASDPRELSWSTLYCDCFDTPQRRYRSGYAGQLSYWRRFGKFSGDQNEIVDPDAECACDQRFNALAEVASRLIDDLGGAGLSVEWRGVPDTRWQLAVHELTKPVSHKLAGTPAVYEKIPDLWLASAAAVAQLVTAPTSPDDARNKFCYEQCVAFVQYGNVERAIKKRPEWEPLNGTSSIKAAAGRYASKFGLPAIPKRQHGRRPGKAK